MALVPDWKNVARYAWSVRLMFLAAVLTGGAVVLPMLDPLIPREWLIWYALAVFVTIVSAFIARFVYQKRFHVE